MKKCLAHIAMTTGTFLRLLPWEKTRFFCTFLFFWVIAITTVPLYAADNQADRNIEADPPFRLSFSANMFRDVNQTDIMAALKVWILTVAKDLEIKVDPDPNIQPSVDAMIRFAETNHVSGFAVLATELLELNSHFTFDQIAVGQNRGAFGDQYVLLVRSDSTIQSLKDLKGASLNLYDSPHMSLGEIWLETMLLENKLGAAKDYFLSRTKETKAGQAVLPVFFGKKTACLITRDTFELMEELNPQLGQQLRVLVQSPIFISAGFAFIKQQSAKGYRDEIIDAMGRLDKNEAGKQLLAMTQSNVIKTIPFTELEKTFSLIRKHALLLKQSKQ